MAVFQKPEKGQFLGFITNSSFAQQDLFNENPIISPEINADHTVTFRIKAPNAEEVSVSGSLDGNNAFANITYEMEKGEDGIWSFTTPVLPSEFYRYHFTVDGVRTDDIGMKYEYVETAGGHTWNNWRDYLAIFAQRLFK